MTVRKRKDTGKWVCDFYYNGERIVRTLKYARTKKEAEQAEAVIMNKVFKQAYGLDKKPEKKFEDFVAETFLPYSEVNKKSFQDDVYICRVLIKAFKGKNLGQITSPMIEEFKQKFFNQPTKHGKKRSVATVNYHLAILSKIFSMAIDAGFTKINPCSKVKKFRLNNQRTRVLSEVEEKRLFSALKDNDLVKNIVTFALHTGMRRGEIFNLKWFDLDFTRDLIQIQESKTNRKRIIPINETVRSMLSGLKRKSEFVFPSPQTGGRLTDIKKGFCRATSEASILDFRFHDLRHTAATRMADNGADVFTLATILGHSDIRMTARYTHATDSAIRNAVANLDKESDFGNELVTKQKRQLHESP